MQTRKLLSYVLSAWCMAFVYDWINKTTGHDIRILVYVGLATLVFGLYIGLYANDNTAKKDEA